MIGAAIAAATAYSAMFLGMAWYAQRVFPSPYQWRRVLTAAGAAVALTAAGKLLDVPLAAALALVAPIRSRCFPSVSTCRRSGARSARAYGSPGVQGDLQDHERDPEADQWVGELESSATTIALATTPSETKPSTRAWFPSAISAGLTSRRPARSRT